MFYFDKFLPIFEACKFCRYHKCKNFNFKDYLLFPIKVHVASLGVHGSIKKCGYHVSYHIHGKFDGDFNLAVWL